MAQMARDDHESGRGTKVEMDFFGGGIISGYVRPKDEETAARLAKQPVPTSINQLRGGVMQLPSLPTGPGLDVSKGVQFRIRTPNPHKVAVSWLRSAYLLVFSLLGHEGYRYAKSEALRPIREQIMNPEVIGFSGGLSLKISGVELPVDPVIMLNHADKPYFWVVKFGDKGVILPCGGRVERFLQITQRPIKLDVETNRVGLWAPTQFRNDFVYSFAMNQETDVAEIDFVGGILEIQMKNGDIWEWIIVDHQEAQSVALPLRRKDMEHKSDFGGG